MPVVGFVCEGSTDVVVLRRMAEAVLGPLDPRTLQPSTDEMDRTVPRGRTGWSEVKAWCQRLDDYGDLFEPLLGEALDLVVVAIDLDIAVHAGLQKAPANLKAYDASALCRIVRSWLPAPLDSRIIIAVPVMSVEAWILAALFPRHPRPDQERNPAAVLVEKGKIQLGSSGPWKRVQEYRKFATSVSSRLGKIRGVCREADRFAAKLERHALTASCT